MIRIACVLGFMGLILSLPAQNFSGGLHLGANVSQVDGDAFAGFNQIGLSMGGFLVYRFNDFLGLNPELQFSQLGSANRIGRIVRTNYIDVPILLNGKVPIGNDGVQSLHFVAGPVFAVLINARDIDLDVTPALNRFDMRVTAGVEYQFGSLSVKARWGYSLIPFTQDGAQVPFQVSRGPFHHYLTFALGWYLIRE